MNKFLLIIKNNWLSFLLIILTTICQYLLFYFGKSVFLSLYILLIFFIVITIHKKNIKIFYLLLIYFIILSSAFLLFNRDFANYIGMNILLCLIYLGIIFLFEKKFENLFIIKRNKIIINISIALLSIILVSLVFITDKANTDKVILRIKNPQKYYEKIENINYQNKVFNNNVLVYIDKPLENSKVSGRFSIEGWTADINELSESVIEDVYFFLDNKPENGGKFLGKKYTWIRREDVQRAFGEKYKDAGYYFEINSNMLENGLHKLYVYAKSSYFGWNYSVLDFVVDN